MTEIFITSKMSHAQKPRFAIDPFQIFCMQQREFVTKGYPHLNSSNVTSILAAQWRAMDQKEKDYFSNLAQSLERNVRNPIRQFKDNKGGKEASENEQEIFNSKEQEDQIQRTIPYKESSPDAIDHGSSSESDNEISIPRIFVVSRTGFGKSIEETSKFLLQITDKKGTD